MTSPLVLHSPMRAWIAPLDEVPDPVFAERMLGDGVALDPLAETLLAPCDGEIIAVPTTRHAVTLRAENGADVLIHVGLETVGLGGRGFEAHVAAGDRVRRGDRLLSFDLDILAGTAKSLLTPLVVTNGDAFDIVDVAVGRTVEAGQPLLRLQPRGATAPTSVAAVSDESVERIVTIDLPHGLHARPAARLAALAQGLEARVELLLGDRRADARSAVAGLTLGARHGDQVRIRAQGPDAAAAVEAVGSLLAQLAAEESQTAPAPEVARRTPPAEVAGDADHLRGVTAAPGLAIGVVARLRATEPVVSNVFRGVAAESQALADALSHVRMRLRTQSAGRGAHHADILAAHEALLSDPDLHSAAERSIAAGASAGAGWQAAIRTTVETLRGLGDALFADRADDLLDLERQVLLALSGEEPAHKPPPRGAVIIAEDLLPSDLIALESADISGVCTVRGGATSHVAILAAAMGVPALAAVGPALLQVAEGASVILDADSGVLRVSPDAAALAAAQSALAVQADRRQRERDAATAPGQLADGTPIEVLANLGAVGEAASALERGAEGCGLFRTEFLYLDRREAPDEDEQAAAYQAAAEALQGRPLTIRTLDAGGDKPLAFSPSPPEANPALGLRGVRASLRDPALLRVQLRAILRVRAPGARRVLVPMVADLADLRAVRAALEEACAELGVPTVAIGPMIETPASALLADQLAEEADFLSIGTNDLTQYVLAMDREQPEFAQRLDGLHPAVLRLIGLAVEGATRHGRPVGVCGGLASDPLAVGLLVGLGVRSLSAAPGAVPTIKAQLRRLDLETCRAAARAALSLGSAQDVRAMAADRFQNVSASR